MPQVWTDNRAVSAQEMSRLSAAIAGTYMFPVGAGGAVTSNSNMAPTVAAIVAGEVIVNGTIDTTGFSSTTVTVTTADTTNPRRDWIWYDGAGACGVTAGTPAAVPVLPDLTAGRIGFYEVYVAANDTSIDAADLIDRRANVPHQWEHIDTQVLTGTAASVSFASINTAYRAFRLTAYIENDANAKDVYLRFNNDSGANYDFQDVRGTGATVDGAVATGQAQIDLTAPLDIAASESALFEILVMKQAAAQEAVVRSSGTILSGATAPSVIMTGATWQNTADLISRIDLVAASNNFAANTRVTLEGFRATT